MRTLGVRPPAIINETAAREIAVKQGLGVVLSGAIERAGGGYQLSVKAIQAVTGNVIASERGRAGDRDQVLPTATRLIAGVPVRLWVTTRPNRINCSRRPALSSRLLYVIRLYRPAGRRRRTTGTRRTGTVQEGRGAGSQVRNRLSGAGRSLTESGCQQRTPNATRRRRSRTWTA